MFNVVGLIIVIVVALAKAVAKTNTTKSQHSTFYGNAPYTPAKNTTSPLQAPPSPRPPQPPKHVAPAPPTIPTSAPKAKSDFFDECFCSDVKMEFNSGFQQYYYKAESRGVSFDPWTLPAEKPPWDY